MGVGKESIAIQLQNFVSGTLIFAVFSFNLSRMFFLGGVCILFKWTWTPLWTLCDTAL